MRGLQNYKAIIKFFKLINQNLRVLLQIREAAINQHVADAAKIQVANADLREEQAALEKDKKNLAKKLGRHELDILG